jgi:hypothetical protein
MTYGVFRHANCTGCLKAGRQHWFVVYATRRDLWERAKAAEDEIGYTIINGISLSELEPTFALMARAGVEPTERTPPQRFWAAARKAVRALPVLPSCALPSDAEAAVDERPCECVV